MLNRWSIFKKLSCKIYSDSTRFSTNSFSCSRIESTILSGIESSGLLSLLQSVTVLQSPFFHDLNTVEEHTSVTLLEGPSIWVCLMFSHDHIEVVMVLRKRQRSPCATPVPLMGGGEGVRGECGVAVHPQDVNLIAWLRPCLPRLFTLTSLCNY